MKLNLSIKASLLLLSSLLLATEASAERLVDCGVTCNSVLTKAKLTSNTMNPGETFSVIDTKSFKATTYQVQQVVKYGEIFFEPVLVGTSSLASSKASEIKTAVRSVEAVDLTIPASVSKSAVDMIVKNQQQQVANYVASNISSMQQFGALVGTLATAFGKMTDVKIVLNIQFANGSRATVETVGLGAGGTVTWQYQEGSAFTVDGVQVPKNASDLLGTTILREDQLDGGFATIASALDILVRTGGVCKSQVQVTCITEMVDGHQVVTCSSYRTCE